MKARPALDPIGTGRVDPADMEILRATGTTQLVVVNEPHTYEPGRWRAVIGRLVASGHFRLVTTDGPFALLEVRSPTPR